MLKKKLSKDLYKRLERAKEDLAKVRDELRDLHDEVREVLDAADSGHLELTDAVDILSQYV